MLRSLRARNARWSVHNLREQARSLGIDDARWPEVAQTYTDVNAMFGDIIKVTPTSKVVGDMALLMMTSGLTKEQVLDPATDVAFPESVVQNCFAAISGSPTAVSRGAAAEDSEGKEAADRAAGRAFATGRPRGRAVKIGRNCPAP